MTRELLQQALDALTVLLDEWTPAREAQLKGTDVITALRSALAAPMPEPVAWLWLDQDGYTTIQTVKPYHDAEPLYAAPPAAPAPVVPLTDEQILNIALKHWRYGDVPIAHRTFARAVLSAAPVVREPVIDEMDAIASQYAHKLALDLECVLSDYNGKWWDTAMQTIGEYRMAMNRIHERESPTHMGEPVLPKISSGVGK